MAVKRIFGCIPKPIVLAYMCDAKKPRSGFELGPPCPFPVTITIAPRIKVGSIRVVNALTCGALLYFMWDLESAQMNV